MTELGKITIGTKFTDRNAVSWRLLARSEDGYHLIRMNTGKRTVWALSNDAFYTRIIEKSFVISADQEAYVVTESRLSDRQKDIFRRKKAFTADIEKAFGRFGYKEFHSTRCTDSEYTEICRRHGYTTTEGARILNAWFQSGFQDCAFVDVRYIKGFNHKTHTPTRKPGRKPAEDKGKLLTEEDRANMRDAMQRYISNPNAKKTTAYEMMVEEKYSYRTADGGWKALPANMMPTPDQFYYFIKVNVSKDTLRNRIERRNAGIRNDRLLNSTTCFDIPGPGCVLEADALEIDLQIVSANDNRKAVGKPVLYMLIDCYSKCIVAAYVNFNNNAKIALRGLLANLFEDKAAACMRHGFDFRNPELMPSNFLPREIRTDNGSDFVSDWFEGACQELGINLVLEPPACGSMKGNIERSFRDFHDSFKQQLAHSGVITNEYGDKSKEEACHDIFSVCELVHEFICHHNGTPRTEQTLKREMNRAMLRDHVTPTPIAFWHYGVKKNGEPRHISPGMLNQTFYKLLEKDRATLQNTTAVKWNGLYYDVEPKKDPDLYARLLDSKKNAGRKDKETGEIVNSMEIRYDLCSVESIFYLKYGRVIELPLSERLNKNYSDVVDMTYDEYEEYKTDVSVVVRKGKRTRLENAVTHIHNTKIIDEEKKSAATEYVKAKNIKENRKVERNDYNYSERISGKMIHIPEAEPAELSDVVSIQPAEEQYVPKPAETAASESVSAVSAVSDEGREEYMPESDYRSALNALFDRD